MGRWRIAILVIHTHNRSLFCGTLAGWRYKQATDWRSIHQPKPQNPPVTLSYAPSVHLRQTG